MSNAGADARRLEFPVLHDPRYPVHEAADRLEPFLRLIVERFHPEKIILFGSYAYGQPGEHSDFDLLVVRPGISSENESDLEIRRALWDVPGPRPPLTILSKTPERIAARLAIGSPFYQDLISRGLLLYAA